MGEEIPKDADSRKNMICCDVTVKCNRCGQDTLVHLKRSSLGETGFGCLTCGTAEKKGEEYFKK
jgi:hypothetical protein